MKKKSNIVNRRRCDVRQKNIGPYMDVVMSLKMDTFKAVKNVHPLDAYFRSYMTWSIKYVLAGNTPFLNFLRHHNSLFIPIMRRKQVFKRDAPTLYKK